MIFLIDFQLSTFRKMIKNLENQTLQDLFDYAGDFSRRHIGPNDYEIAHMLEVLDLPDVDTLIDQTIPANIRMKGDLNLPEPLSEKEALADMVDLANKNKIFRSLISKELFLPKLQWQD